MICYRDRTFCSFYIDCAKECDRALTDEVKDEAQCLGIPICQWADKPDCFVGGEDCSE